MFNLPCFCFSTGQGGDTDSFHASMWDEERSRRQTIHFAFPEEDEESVWDAADIYIIFISLYNMYSTYMGDLKVDITSLEFIFTLH